jgi:hypothetical protein
MPPRNETLTSPSDTLEASYEDSQSTYMQYR